MQTDLLLTCGSRHALPESCRIQELDYSRAALLLQLSLALRQMYVHFPIGFLI